MVKLSAKFELKLNVDAMIFQYVNWKSLRARVLSGPCL